MSKPLTGLLVVAVEQAVAAPCCTVRLADAGARVIKIERAEGDTARNYDAAVHGTSAYFAWLNRGKESAVLNIKDPSDRALLEAMVAKADIFVQNIVPGAAKRLGLSADELVARFPGIIAVDISGYDQASSYRDMRAYDMLIQAESGVCSVTGTPDEPVKVGVSIADIATGMTAHTAVLEALIERGITGKGKAIEINMFDVLADFMSVPLLHHEYGGRETARHGFSHASIYPYDAFQCADGEIVLATQNDREFAALCNGVILQPELANDPRFLHNMDRVAHRTELRDIIRSTLSVLPSEDAIARLEKSKVAWSRVSTVADLSKHPALRRMNVDVPGARYSSVASPLHRDLSPGAVPKLGEHTDDLWAEFSS